MMSVVKLQGGDAFTVFPFFSKDFRGSEERKILAFLGGFPCFPQKSKERKIRVICSNLL